MKTWVMIAVLLLAAAGCTQYSQRPGTNRDALGTSDADTLYNEEAVIKQVNAIYEYYNNFDAPRLDDLFGTKAWRDANDEVMAVQMDDNFDDESFWDGGGTSPWTYFFYEEHITVTDIKVALQKDATANVTFKIKGDEAPETANMHWLMKVEDGEWRVEDVYEGDLSILKTMRDWVAEQKLALRFNIAQHIGDMNRAAGVYTGDDIEFDQYALLDVDHDGVPEVLARTMDWVAAFATGSGKPVLLFAYISNCWPVFYEHGLGYQGSCGTGCHQGGYAVLKNSKEVHTYELFEQYDMEGNPLPDECEYTIDGKRTNRKTIAPLFDEKNSPLGKSVDMEPYWRDVPDAVG